MSAGDSTEPVGFAGLSPLEREAARGELPEWARATPARRAHMGRVAALLEDWAHRLELGESEALRWAAAGWLHDALRDENPEVLRRDVSQEERDLPGSVLHGPAVATRVSGLVDRGIVAALRYHTIGHPSLDRLGKALFLADFLEPGRDFAIEWRSELRERMPAEMEEVLLDVLSARIRHLLDRRKPIRPETAAFWSSVVQRDR